MYPSKRSKTFGIFVKNQVELLRGNGIDVNVIAVNDPRKGKKNVIIKYLAFFIKSFMTILFKGRNYDLVHVHYIFPTGLAGLLFKFLYGKKLIVTSHGGDIDQMINKGSLARNWTRKILVKSDKVIAVGEKLKQDIIQEFQVDEEKIAVLNMGVNRSIFTPKDKKRLRKDYKIVEDGMVFLFVGNFIKKKGLDELVEAFQMFKQNNPNSSLHLIGEPKDPGYFQLLNEKINKLSLKDIHFHPSKDQLELSDWMNMADLFILPSYIEGFGLVALEAMACGTPVIGSDVGGLSYLLADQYGEKVEPQNITAIFQAMEKLMKNPDRRANLRENGLLKAKENDHGVLLQKLIELYAR